MHLQCKAKKSGGAAKAFVSPRLTFVRPVMVWICMHTGCCNFVGELQQSHPASIFAKFEDPPAIANIEDFFSSWRMAARNSTRYQPVEQVDEKAIGSVSSFDDENHTTFRISPRYGAAIPWIVHFSLLMTSASILAFSFIGTRSGYRSCIDELSEYCKTSLVESIIQLLAS